MKRILLAGISLCTVLFFIYYTTIAYYYYAPPKHKTPYQIRKTDNDTIRIAYIGDSWAYMHQQQEQCLIPQITEEQVQSPTRVYSYGLSGKTSKEIYEALFTDNRLRKLMLEQGAEYCFISVGINDVNKKMSTQYYQKSMDGIIGFLLSNNIHPIILEIPDFDVYKAYRGLQTNRKILRKLSMIINDVPMDCKQIFRDALDTLVKENGYQHKVSIIRYKTWNNDYSNDQNRLYLRDGVHLNNYGYSVLDSVIARVILTNIKK